MNRREFCKFLSLLSGGYVLGSMPYLTALAQSALPEFFILIHVENGWDTSLAMDPWTQETRPSESDYFLEYSKDELVPFSNGYVTNVMNPMNKYFDRLALFNGIFMNSQDNGHDGLARYATSGNGQGDLGALPVELEGRKFSSDFGIVSNGSINSGNRTVSTCNTSGIIGNGQLSTIRVIENGQEKTELQKAIGSFAKSKGKMDLFNRQLAEFKRVNNTLTEAQVVAAAFASGLSQSGFFRISDDNLDTHSSHAGAHKEALTKVMTKIASYLDTLASVQVGLNSGVSVLDQTTVLVVSEFTRTPALNSAKGKDHNPQSNSAMLISKKIKPMQIGASKLVVRNESRLGIPYLTGLPLDQRTFEPVHRRDDTFILRPENVIATTLASLNMNPALVSPSLGNAKVIQSLLKG